jgi:hypothetical protein
METVHPYDSLPGDGVESKTPNPGSRQAPGGKRLTHG